jgi:hypothetical protein
MSPMRERPISSMKNVVFSTPAQREQGLRVGPIEKFLRSTARRVEMDRAADFSSL